MLEQASRQSQKNACKTLLVICHMKICLNIPSALVSLYLDIRWLVSGGPHVKLRPHKLLAKSRLAVTKPRFPVAFRATINLVCERKSVPAQNAARDRWCWVLCESLAAAGLYSQAITLWVVWWTVTKCEGSITRAINFHLQLRPQVCDYI